ATATFVLYSLSLHDALPICKLRFSQALMMLSRQQGKTMLSKLFIEYFLYRLRVSEIMFSAQDYNHANKLFEEIRDEVDEIPALRDRKSTRLNSSHVSISYAV